MIVKYMCGLMSFAGYGVTAWGLVYQGWQTEALVGACLASLFFVLGLIVPTNSTKPEKEKTEEKKKVNKKELAFELAAPREFVWGKTTWKHAKFGPEQF